MSCNKKINKNTKTQNKITHSRNCEPANKYSYSGGKKYITRHKTTMPYKKYYRINSPHNHSDSVIDSDGDCDSDSDGDCDSDSNSDSASYSDNDSESESDTDGDSYVNCESDRY